MFGKHRKVRVETFDPDDSADIQRLRDMVKAKGTPEAHAALAMLLFETGDEAYGKEMIEHFSIAAEAGNETAMGRLGDIYFSGAGVPVDIEKALSYYRKAADMGNPEAMFSLGNEYFNGNNMPYDHAKAFEILTKSAELGSHRAMNSLGVMYLCGFHVEKDIGKARKLFAKARARGNRNAAINLQLIKECGKDCDYKAIFLENGVVKDYRG